MMLIHNRLWDSHNLNHRSIELEGQFFDAEEGLQPQNTFINYEFSWARQRPYNQQTMLHGSP